MCIELAQLSVDVELAQLSMGVELAQISMGVELAQLSVGVELEQFSVGVETSQIENFTTLRGQTQNYALYELGQPKSFLQFFSDLPKPIVLLI